VRGDAARLRGTTLEKNCTEAQSLICREYRASHRELPRAAAIRLEGGPLTNFDITGSKLVIRM
jgi:hypothetical protein